MRPSLFSQIVPTEDSGKTNDDPPSKPDRRSRKYVARPGFSLPLMSNNFRRFNARIGVVFILQNRLIRLFTWVEPTQTLSFLALYTFLCLSPQLCAVVPVACYLLFVMVPAFTAKHPLDGAGSTDHYGRREKQPHTFKAKPAPEFSKDFFRNLRDLQNSMEDFSRLHDRVLDLVLPYTNFSNEPLSSSLFLALFTLTCVLFVAAHSIPWRAVFLVAGWVMVALGHPASMDLLGQITSSPTVVRGQRIAKEETDLWVKTDTILDGPPESHEVEIFELQRRTTRRRVSPEQRAYSGTADMVEFSISDEEEDAVNWEHYIYSTTAFTPFSPARLAGAKPSGTPFSKTCGLRKATDSPTASGCSINGAENG